MALFGLIWSYHFWDQLSLLSDLYVHTVSTPPKVLPSRQCQNFAAIDKEDDADDDQMMMRIWWTGNPDQRESSLPAELSQKRCGWWWWWWSSQLGWWCWWSLENRTGTCLFNYFKLQLQLLCNFPQPCTDLNLDENAKYRNSKIQDIFWGLLFRFVGAHRIFTFLLCI